MITNVNFVPNRTEIGCFYQKTLIMQKSKKGNLFTHCRPNVLNGCLTANHSFTQSIFQKTLIGVDSSHLYGSFGTFCIQIGQLFESQWEFKLSEEIKIDLIFLQKQ